MFPHIERESTTSKELAQMARVLGGLIRKYGKHNRIVLSEDEVADLKSLNNQAFMIEMDKGKMILSLATPEEAIAHAKEKAQGIGKMLGDLIGKALKELAEESSDPCDCPHCRTKK